jgi:hypothetical protein
MLHFEARASKRPIKFAIVVCHQEAPASLMNNEKALLRRKHIGLILDVRHSYH